MCARQTWLDCRIQTIVNALASAEDRPPPVQFHAILCRKESSPGLYLAGLRLTEIRPATPIDIPGLIRHRLNRVAHFRTRRDAMRASLKDSSANLRSARIFLQQEQAHMTVIEEGVVDVRKTVDDLRRIQVKELK